MPPVPFLLPPPNFLSNLNFKILSLTPLIFQYDSFLTPTECASLINLSKPYLAPLLTDDDKVSTIRTGSGAFLPRSSIPNSYKRPSDFTLVKIVEDRLSFFTSLPVINGEPLQVLKYRGTQKYQPHVDYLSTSNAKNKRGDREILRNGGERLATALVYLNDMEECDGGGTCFPLAVPEDKDNSSKRGILITPKLGRLIVWFNCIPIQSELVNNAKQQQQQRWKKVKPDKKSLHESLPVVRGEKWALSKWFRVGEFEMDEEAVRAAGY